MILFRELTSISKLKIMILLYKHKIQDKIDGIRI